MSLIKRLRSRRAVPHDYEITSALHELMTGAGMAAHETSMAVSEVAGTRRPAYQVLLGEPYADTASSLLTDLLNRPFSPEHTRWLIDAREARALIEAAHRVSQVRKK